MFTRLCNIMRFYGCEDDNLYKRTVKQFRTLRITASVLFGYFFIKAYAVGTHLNCIDLYPQHMLLLPTHLSVRLPIQQFPG